MPEEERRGEGRTPLSLVQALRMEYRDPRGSRAAQHGALHPHGVPKVARHSSVHGTRGLQSSSQRTRKDSGHAMR